MDRVADLRSRLSTFKGSSFNLPVLRDRAMINWVRAPGLEARRYLCGYGDNTLDLCGVFSVFDWKSEAGLHELCRALRFPGKPQDIDGADVDRFVQEGRVTEVIGYEDDHHLVMMSLPLCGPSMGSTTHPSGVNNLSPLISLVGASNMTFPTIH